MTTMHIQANYAVTIAFPFQYLHPLLLQVLTQKSPIPFVCPDICLIMIVVTKEIY